MNNLPIALLCLALSGCVEMPVLREAKPALPQAMPGVLPDTAALKVAHELRLKTWWIQFEDPALNRLIDEALAHNADLQRAAARIEEARAALGQTEADRAPEADLSVDGSRKRSSEKGSATLPHPINNDITVNAAVSYEADLWGRYRAASAAARADLLVTRHAREVVRVGLIDAVAAGYFRLTALDAQLALTDITLGNRREAVELNRVRLDGGIAGELPLRQAEAELAAIEAGKAELARQMRQQETALAVLLGRSPRDLVEAPLTRGKSLDDLSLPPAIPAGLPSELIARRPDIRQAEQALAGAHARVKMTQAALYPSLSLTANLGTESKSLSDLFSGPSAIWGLGASLVQSLYSAGRLEAAVRGEAARHEQSLIAYEETVRTAFREVLDALVAARQAREVEAAESRRASALTRAAELADLRYQNGISSYLEVLDAQRNLHQARQARIEARRTQLAATAALMKALGGGWAGVQTTE